MFDPDQIYRALVQYGDKWADAHEVAELAEESKKVLLAQITSEQEGSQAAKEAKALADPRYEEHIRAMVKARKAANRAKVRYDSAKVKAELLRTQAANDRAAMKHAT